MYSFLFWKPVDRTSIIDMSKSQYEKRTKLWWWKHFVFFIIMESLSSIYYVQAVNVLQTAVCNYARV